MKRVGRGLALVIGTLLFVACVLGAWRSDLARSARSSGRVDATTNPVSSAYPSTPVAREIDELKGAHAWAGRYVRSTGYGGDDVCVAPQAGFVRWSNHDFPPFETDLSEGDVVARGSQLELRDPSATDSSSEWVVVHWGARRYLLAASEIRAFCSAIQTGEEPRTSRIGRFLLREGDEKLTAGPISTIEPRDLCH